MNPALTALAVATLVGGVLAVSARDVRTVVLGLLVVLLAAPLIADPWPGPIPILVRVAAALLAVRLIVVGVRGLSLTSGLRIGWLAAALLASAAGIAGVASHGLGAPGLGPAAAQGAAFGLVMLAIPPLVVARDALRLGVAAVLLVSGAVLLRVALDRPAGDGEHLVEALLTIGLGGAIAVVAFATSAAGGSEVAPPGGHLPGRRLPDAHRMTDAERPRSMTQPPAARAEPGTEPAMASEPEASRRTPSEPPASGRATAADIAPGTRSVRARPRASPPRTTGAPEPRSSGRPARRPKPAPEPPADPPG